MLPNIDLSAVETGSQFHEVYKFYEVFKYINMPPTFLYVHVFLMFINRGINVGCTSI